jgi:hypothetical protein
VGRYIVFFRRTSTSQGFEFAGEAAGVSAPKAEVIIRKTATNNNIQRREYMFYLLFQKLI